MCKYEYDIQVLHIHIRYIHICIYLFRPEFVGL